MNGNYVIVANVAAADSSLRLGARVIVLGVPGNPDHVRVQGLSRGGRAISKWTMSKRLKSIRPAWEHRPPETCTLSFATKEEAARYIAARFPGDP